MLLLLPIADWFNAAQARFLPLRSSPPFLFQHVVPLVLSGTLASPGERSLLPPASVCSVDELPQVASTPGLVRLFARAPKRWQERANDAHPQQLDQCKPFTQGQRHPGNSPAIPAPRARLLLGSFFRSNLLVQLGHVVLEGARFVGRSIPVAGNPARPEVVVGLCQRHGAVPL